MDKNEAAKESFARYVRIGLANTGMTAIDAAAKAGVDRSTLWNYTQGRIPDNLLRAAAVARTLGFSLDDALMVPPPKVRVTFPDNMVAYPMKDVPEVE